MLKTWRKKSNSTSKIPRPYGMDEVVNPRTLTYSGTSHQWFAYAERASRTLPTIWVHMCSVAQVSFQSSRCSSGQNSALLVKLMSVEFGREFAGIETSQGDVSA